MRKSVNSRAFKLSVRPSRAKNHAAEFAPSSLKHSGSLETFPKNRWRTTRRRRTPKTRASVKRLGANARLLQRMNNAKLHKGIPFISPFGVYCRFAGIRRLERERERDKRIGREAASVINTVLYICPRNYRTCVWNGGARLDRVN